MAIGIDDLDDDDILDGEQQPINQEPPVNEPPTGGLEEDFMSDFLKTRGIDDPTQIYFEGDDGNIISRDWKDLTKEEKINILNTPLETPLEVDDEHNLSDEELSLILTIRESNLSPQDYLAQLLGETVVQEPRYSVDDYTDDELYLLDLESRVGELSDEEAANALNIAKQSEEFYKKQVEGIRKEYKEKEDLKNLQELAKMELERLEAFNQYQEQVIDSINKFTSIGNLDLNFEDDDKEELAEFMLSLDKNGVNYLYLALQDPELLTRAAWFILKGEEAFNNVADYFKNLIKLVSENQYKKGLEDGKKGSSSKPNVVIDNSKKPVHRSYNSINDLDDDE